MIKTLFTRHKKIIYLIIFIIIIIILSFLPVEKSPPLTSPSSPPPIPQAYTPPFYTQPQSFTDGQVDASLPAVQAAVQAKQKLAPHLPIYIENFQTSVNLPTTINLYTLSTDPGYLIHFDIYGIDYQNQNSDPTINPHVTAFKESFLHAQQQLTQLNLNLKDLYFVFGGQEFIQQTAELWINSLNLLQ